jgi:hypothetical protein
LVVLCKAQFFEHFYHIPISLWKANFRSYAHLRTTIDQRMVTLADFGYPVYAL